MKLIQELLTEYNQPETFDKDRIEKAINLVFRKDGGWFKKMLRSMILSVPDNDLGNTTFVFDRMLRAGFTSDEINSIRTMVTKVYRGMLKTMNVKYKPTKRNFTGVVVNILDAENFPPTLFDNIYKQVMANMTQKFLKGE